MNRRQRRNLMPSAMCRQGRLRHSFAKCANRPEYATEFEPECRFSHGIRVRVAIDISNNEDSSINALQKPRSSVWALLDGTLNAQHQIVNSQHSLHFVKCKN
uniref:Uncharacterized protein n=1 Tax=Plectus sambesii TaxID=2011161 RepID=A0A914WDH7_9BILA